jgi:N-acetylglucosamine-6-phosphate deacetylase
MIKGLKNVNILTPQGIIKGDIHIKAEKINEITVNSTFEGLEFSEAVLVVPGFIDQHIHGANASDTMDGTKEALINISRTLPKEGTTSFLPTTMTQSEPAIKKALASVKALKESKDSDGAEVLGVHLEGPFININASGAQPREYIVNPTIEQFETYQKASGNLIKLVTIAPEVEGGLALIEYCKKHNIIASIGHTKAKYQDVLIAINKGASSVTHCYNAMSGLHHRDLGVVGAAFLHNELNAEIIVDGIHVHEKAVSLLYKNKSAENITLVTDSLRAKWLNDGEYDLGGQMVTVKNNEARLKDGTLAGSTLKMIDAVKNSMKFLNIGIEEAVRMAATNPAINLGVYDRKGSIEVGKDADLVVLNKDYDIIMTITRGKIGYQKGV